ncbi:hypothetical protein BU24DRAFT_459418 [Aaosphaeria arxii CBS 175.79]|uniref:Uncharacterized protein n=1 Tax=Aaosphaeria arxii CBS 175.79 TaxID=1450172 RepID=A0A6A5Y3E8_9PLEO|nr:uncharacterized protein BU24DRAFT_459418 [Aaosphaeria arxii CBS 175.79]KAF2019786.1 hypothetical protein BU24DRAFT_459418 [Aaosphaeria arxii CBS 175.79]
MKDELSNTGLLTAEETSWKEQKPQRPRWHWIVALVSSLLITNFLTFIVTFKTASIPYVSVATPPKGVPRILSKIPKKPGPKFLNSTFYDQNDDILWKHSSHEVEQAWHNLTQGGGGLLMISKEDAAQADIDPKRHAYWNNPEAGLVGYPVGIEVLHQVHCLNLIRANLYYNRGFTEKNCEYTACGVPEDYAQLHIDHCVDLIRSRLMCTADVGIVPMIWLGDKGRITGDMGRMHTCRNYDAVRQFAIDNARGVPELGVVKPAKDDFRVDDYI